MPYYQETVIAGRVMERRKKHSSRLGVKGIPRSENINPTPEEQEKVNQANAERNVRWLLNGNFQDGDFHMVPGFKKDLNPTPEEAIEAYNKLMRDLRRLYKKEGSELKYISAMERGERGQKKIHFHIVVNYMETKKITALWPWGRIRFFPLDDSGQYADLAHYIIKRTSKTFQRGEGFKKRFNSSRNLEKPDIENEVISAREWVKEPKPLKGYYIEKDKTVNGISKVTGYPYQFYSMVQIRPERKKVRKRE